MAKVISPIGHSLGELWMAIPCDRFAASELDGVESNDEEHHQQGS
jgi:hypothetical protein